MECVLQGTSGYTEHTLLYSIAYARPNDVLFFMLCSFLVCSSSHVDPAVILHLAYRSSVHVPSHELDDDNSSVLYKNESCQPLFIVICRLELHCDLLNRRIPFRILVRLCTAAMLAMNCLPSTGCYQPLNTPYIAYSADKTEDEEAILIAMCEL